MWAVEVDNMCVAYHKTPAIWNVDFKIPEGSLCGVVGPNGAGKSTLLKAILQEVRMTLGSVSVFGVPLSLAKHRLSYVPQKASVDWSFPITVFEVVLMGAYRRLGPWGRVTKEERDLAEKNLALVGMSGYMKRQIRELSGGQQQRVFFARALMQNADLYLMDEPFAGIDMLTESILLDVLKTLKKEGKTIVIVHHNLATAASLFDYILLLNTYMIIFDTPEVALQPQFLEKAFGASFSLLQRVRQESQAQHQGQG